MVQAREIAIMAGTAALSGAALYVAFGPETLTPTPIPPIPAEENPLVIQARQCKANGIALEDCMDCPELKVLGSFDNEFQPEAAKAFWLGAKCKPFADAQKCEDARTGIRKLSEILANPAQFGCDLACQRSVQEDIDTLTKFLQENCPQLSTFGV